MSARFLALCSNILIVLIPFCACGAGKDPEVENDEQLLKKEGIATDGPSLVAYFKARTLQQKDIDAMAAAVRKLGDNDFDVREKASQDLIDAGWPAARFLKTALNDSDLEIARRAKHCLEVIQASKPVNQVIVAAAGMLAERRPEGGVAALLTYLPSNDDDAVEEAVFRALAKVGLREGKPDPAITAALSDKHPLRRAAAAHVLGRAGSADARRPVTRLLSDSDPRVRFEAAAGLTRSGDKSAVPVLIAQLTDAPQEYAWRSEEMLQRLGGDDSPDVGLGSSEERHRDARTAWETWWRTKGNQVDFAKLKNEEPLLGITLVCEYDGHRDGGRVYELGKDGKPAWTISGLQGPNDVQRLPGGNVLIAERNGNRVTERDRRGTIIWQHADMQSPIACQRLPGGNTLITTFGELFELSAIDGRKVHTMSGSFRYATRLRSGHVLYVASNGQIVELDNEWKELRKVMPEKFAAGAGYWASAEMMPNGHLLVALGGQNRVVEMDWTGKVYMDIEQPNCVFATRLPNGHILISCFEQKKLVEVDRYGRQIMEVDRQGETVPRVVNLEGRAFAVRRY